MHKGENSLKMKLEFKVYEIKENTRSYKQLIENIKFKNEFIIVGEAKLGEQLDCFKAQAIDEKGITIIGGMKIDEAALFIPKEDMKIIGDGVSYETEEFDIPKKYLTMEIIENIQRLNE